MRYQLVLQWQASSLDDYDSMIRVEESLIKGLPNGGEVDGHDGGSGQVNIFIHTDNPIATFEDVRNIIEGTEAWINIKVAYRDFEQSEYTVLWPASAEEFEIS